MAKIIIIDAPKFFKISDEMMRELIGLEFPITTDLPARFTETKKFANMFFVKLEDGLKIVKNKSQQLHDLLRDRAESRMKYPEYMIFPARFCKLAYTITKAYVDIRPFSGCDCCFKGNVRLFDVSGKETTRKNFIRERAREVTTDLISSIVKKALPSSCKKANLIAEEQKSAPPASRFFIVQVN